MFIEKCIDKFPLPLGAEDIEAPAFMQEFAHLCAKGAAQGWHEANGGNVSYLLSESDVEQCQEGFAQRGIWRDLKHAVPALSGAHVLMTASGAYLSNVAEDLQGNAGVIALNAEGSAWRPVWGFEGQARPSSELETHLAAFEVGIRSGDGACRVIYHAHSPHVIALSALIEPSTQVWTRTLWQIMTESIIVFPQGVGVVPWMVPGSPELAQATTELMGIHKVCVWTNHGIMTRAASFDEAFGQVETVEKSAGIYLQARAANGGKEPAHLVSDDQLRAICKRYGITANESFLK